MLVSRVVNPSWNTSIALVSEYELGIAKRDSIHIFPSCYVLKDFSTGEAELSWFISSREFKNILAA